MMADSSSRVMMSSEHPAVGMDQITVVRIDDTHIAEEQCHDGGKVKGGAECYEVEYSMPTEEEEEEEAAGEEEEDGVYVIEYSNPEEEGESYQFTMSVDRSLPAKKPITKHPVVGESARAPSPVMSKPSRPQVRRRRRLIAEEEAKKKKEEEEGEEEVVSNKCVLELGEDYREVMGMNSGSDKRQLVCTLCPPGRFFKRAAGLAVHLKHMHHLEGNKTFFCPSCNQTVRTQIELDLHTKRHANQDAVFTCHLCAAETDKTGYKGSRWGLRRHLETEHPGVVPQCHICSKNFRTLVSYLADQFRHVGVTPYFCARCQIYEMTQRGLSVHIRNHDRKKKKKQESGVNDLQTFGVSANADNSATDDSDF